MTCSIRPDLGVKHKMKAEIKIRITAIVHHETFSVLANTLCQFFVRGESTFSLQDSVFSVACVVTESHQHGLYEGRAGQSFIHRFFIPIEVIDEVLWSAMECRVFSLCIVSTFREEHSEMTPAHLRCTNFVRAFLHVHRGSDSSKKYTHG